MIKYITFYGKNGCVTLYSNDLCAFERQRLYMNDDISKRSASIISKASPNLEIEFNCLKRGLTNLLSENEEAIIQFNLSSRQIDDLISYILRDLNNSNFFNFFKFKMVFECEKPLPTKFIGFKLSRFCKNSSKSIKYFMETYQGVSIWGEDKVKKFEITIKL
jgi:hypothetical protein